MAADARLILVRLLPVVLIALAAGLWFNDVQSGGRWVFRNLVPLALLVLFAALVLVRGGGLWSGAGKRLPFGVAGFAIPALGLSVYLHYAYAVNLNDMFSRRHWLRDRLDRRAQHVSRVIFHSREVC